MLEYLPLLRSYVYLLSGYSSYAMRRQSPGLLLATQLTSNILNAVSDSLPKAGN